MSKSFLFLFAPNNSGTTAMCQYLAAQQGAYLPPFGNNEGQMAPAVRDIMRDAPWDPNNVFDWKRIRAEWEKLVNDASQEVFVEGSPPNILRVDAIVEAFGDSMLGAFSISNPYMQISSCIKNYHKGSISDPILSEFTQLWLLKADVQMQNVVRYRDRFALVKYEEFCAEPSLLNKAFGLPGTSPGRIDGKRNSGIENIVDLSVKNISFLTVFEVSKISEFLAERRDLLDFFGYSTLSSTDFNTKMSSNLGFMQAGLLDRFNWELRAIRRERKRDR